MKQQALLFLLGTALAEGSSGFVNLKDGSFNLNPESKQLQILELNYSSRRNSQGIFGAGWCSLLDWEIRPGRGRLLELKNCDVIQRFEKAKTSALVGSKTQYFESLDDEQDRIEENAASYVYHANGKTYHFDPKGRLFAIESFEQVQLRVLARSKTSLRLQVHGELIDLATNSGGLVQKWKQAQNPELHFRYNGRQLTRLNSPRSPAWNFAYDPFDNMTAYGRGESPQVFLDYDRATDRVVKVQSSQDCPEKFEYELVEGLPTNRPSRIKTATSAHEFTLISSSWFECKSERYLNTRIQNRFLKTPGGEVLLSESWIKTKDRIRHLEFHPILGSLVRDTNHANKNDKEFNPQVRPKTRLASE